MSSDTRDVVVVGAGIIGCLTAYLLAKGGLKVTLLEADSVGSHASGFAFGEMGAIDGAGLPDPLLEFSLWSLRRHEPLAKELFEVSGVDNEYQARGRLKLAFNDEEARAYKKDLEWQSKVTELGVEWLDSQEVVKVEPLANPECLGAVYLQRAAMVEPYRHTLAAAQAAEKLGVESLLRRATGLVVQGDRCLGVTFENGTIQAGMVVLAMGPWTQQAASWHGANIPVTPLKGQILRLQHSTQRIRTSLHYSGSYVASKPDGLIWAGTTEEEVGFDEETTLQARDKIMGDLLKMAPSMADAELVQQTACLRPLSGDGLPIVGKVPGWENLYVGTGAGRKGILWSTGMCHGLADLILTGRTEVPGVHHLDPARFQRD
ncbi:MAG: FAD-dependent oxidoreductase [Chloroflexi bacterium]|nr:FAD-dependent oxidoreductase [Chloroflexota bacterium]